MSNLTRRAIIGAAIIIGIVGVVAAVGSLPWYLAGPICGVVGWTVSTIVERLWVPRKVQLPVSMEALTASDSGLYVIGRWGIPETRKAA